MSREIEIIVSNPSTNTQPVDVDLSILGSHKRATVEPGFDGIFGGTAKGCASTIAMMLVVVGILAATLACI